MKYKNKSKERGSVSVEFMLLVPALVIMILGAIHFGRVFTVKHRITEAVNYAVRAAVATPDPASTVQGIFNSRLVATGGNGGCASISLDLNTTSIGFAQEALEAKVTCVLLPPIGSAMLGITGGGRVRATAAMPYPAP